MSDDFVPVDGVVHVIREAESPPDADVWRMWCGAECFAFDNGTLVPAIDFYHEADAEKATCPGCLSTLWGSGRATERAQVVRA